jgi:hypothetical protein
VDSNAGGFRKVVRVKVVLIDPFIAFKAHRGLGEPQLAARKVFHRLCFESKALLPRESVTFSVTVPDLSLKSFALPCGRLWYTKPDDSIGYAKFYSRSHHAVIHVYDDAGNVIATHEHAGDFVEP